jgi:hypothetical protein
MKFRKFIFSFIIVAVFAAFPVEAQGLGGIGGAIGAAVSALTGNVNGPIGSAGVPVVNLQDTGGNDANINIPNQGNPRSNADCEGDKCGIGESFSEQLSAEANIAVISPMGALKETMNSKKMGDVLSASVSAGGQALSPLALSFQSWNSASPQAAAALDRSLSFAMGFGQQRYQAEQNAQLAFDSAGEGGKKLSEAYRRCMAVLVSQDFTYASAQESCLKQQDQVVLTATKKEITDANHILSFKFHPSHPAFVGKRSVFKDNTWKEQLVTNAQYVSAIFPNDIQDTDQIKLRHLLFVPTLVNAGLGAFLNSGTVKTGVIQLAHDWGNLFGDIQYVYQRGGTPNTSFMRTAVRRIKPFFSYQSAVTANGVKQFKADIFNQKGATGFEQYAAFKTHYAYYTLWKVLTKYCRVNQALSSGAGNSGPAPSSDAFWTPSEVDSPNRISRNEVQLLSSSYGSFDRVIGQDFYTYAKILFPAGNDSLSMCDMMDPTLTPVFDSKVLDKGETAVSKLLSDKPGASNGVAGVRWLTLTYASIIAGDQVNTSVATAYAILGNLSGGDFESEARKAGVNLLRDVAPNYGSRETAEYFELSRQKLINELKERIAPASK